MAKAPSKKASAAKGGGKANGTKKATTATASARRASPVVKGNTRTAASKPTASKSAPTKATTKTRSNGAKSASLAAKPAPSPAKSTNSKPAPKVAPRPEAAPARPAPAAAEKPAKSNKDRDGDRRGINVPAPIPTDAKPAKNRVGLKSSELEHYRDLLLAKRRELVGDMSSMEREALNRGGSSNLSNLPMHMADMGTDNYEQEFTLGLMEKDRNLLREINAALAKIQDGSYGICEGTGLPISKPRLEAQPWARYSIEHARKLEQRGVR